MIAVKHNDRIALQVRDLLTRHGVSNPALSYELQRILISAEEAGRELLTAATLVLCSIPARMHEDYADDLKTQYFVRNLDTLLSTIKKIEEV